MPRKPKLSTTVNDGRLQPKHRGEISALRAARHRAGLSLEQLCVKAGVSRATLFLAERAPSLMTERTAKACAAALGVDVDDVREDGHAA